MASQDSQREALLKGLVGQSSRRVLAYAGSCAVCAMTGRGGTVFTERGSWARDHLRCIRCGAIPRERCLAKVLGRARPDWRLLKIHESSPADRGLSRALGQGCAGYSSSQLIEGAAPGEVVDGVRNENLSALTFADDSVDVFITQDVLEHVIDPDAAMAEIRRVLRPDGVHLATFPWNPDLRASRARALSRGDGEVVHLLEPEYHGNPVGDGRSLVTWDWGADLFGYAHRMGFHLTVLKLPHHRRFGIDGEFREVFMFEPR